MDALTVYGVAALTFMMLMYAVESRGRVYILDFAPVWRGDQIVGAVDQEEEEASRSLR